MQAWVKDLGLSLLDASGAFQLSRRLFRDNLVVLTYHHVFPDTLRGVLPPLANAVYERDFDEQLQFVASRYHVVTGEQLRAFLVDGQALPPYSLLITFDDGYRNNYQYAFPILQRHRLTATFFLSTGFVGERHHRLWFDRLDMAIAADPNGVLDAARAEGTTLASTIAGLRLAMKLLSPEKRDRVLRAVESVVRYDEAALFPRERLEPMTWAEVREMADAGMHFGGHTKTHQIVSALESREYDTELRECRETIETSIGHRCWAFSYPNGERDNFRPADQDALRRIGFEAAFTQISGMVKTHSDRFAIPRMPVPSSEDLRVFQSRASGAHWLLNRMHA